MLLVFSTPCPVNDLSRKLSEFSNLCTYISECEGKVVYMFSHGL